MAEAPLLFRDGRPVPRRGATVEVRPEGVYLRWPDRSGAFYARSTLLMPISGGSEPHINVYGVPHILAMNFQNEDYVVQGLLRKGWTTLVSGREKIGKNVGTLSMVAAIEKGEKFLDHSTRPAKFLLATEESEDVLQEKLLDTGARNLQIVFMYELRQLKTWRERVDFLVSAAVERELDGVIIDHFQRLAMVRDENTPELGEAAGLFADAVREAQVAGELLHHYSKAGTPRGHTSLGATIDVSMTIEREPGDEDHESRVRFFRSEGRRRATNWNAVAQLSEDYSHYEMLGTISEYRRSTSRVKVDDRAQDLAATLRSQGLVRFTRKQLQVALKDPLSGEEMSTRTAGRKVKELLEANLAVVTADKGEGNAPIVELLVAEEYDF
jgi:hypothetical protein